jgi:hypothetical protein
LPVQGAVRPAAVVVGEEGVAEGLQLGHGVRLLGFGFEPVTSREVVCGFLVDVRGVVT